MSRRLKFGLPSKGRLQEQVASHLSDRGIQFVKSRVDREYSGGLKGVEGVELVFLSAGEMPQKLARGEVHLAVTGEDLVRERAGVGADLAPEKIMMLEPLGFGHADLIIAVPKCWIDVDTTADLDDVAADFRARHGFRLRVATKYPRLVRRFFRMRGVENYRLVDSQGATEGLVAARAAEAVADITSSGETLRANHLKVLSDGVVLASQAQLCASLTADWSGGPRAALDGLLARFSQSAAAVDAAEIEADIDAEALERARAALSRVGVSAIKPAAGGGYRLAAPQAASGLAVEILLAAGAARATASAAKAPARDAPSAFAEFLRRISP